MTLTACGAIGDELEALTNVCRARPGDLTKYVKQGLPT